MRRRRALFRRFDAAKSPEQKDIVEDFGASPEEKRSGKGNDLHDAARDERAESPTEVSGKIRDPAGKHTFLGAHYGGDVRLTGRHVHFDERLAAKKKQDRDAK